MLKYKRVGCVLLACALVGATLVFDVPETMAQAVVTEQESGTPVIELLPDQPVTYTLKVKQTLQLKAQTAQQDESTQTGSGAAADDSIRWASEDEAVATVDQNGLVTAVAEGQTIIHGASANGGILTCKLTVSGYLVTGITLNKKTVSMTPGEQTVIRATVLPEGSGAAVTWESDNKAVATVDTSGRVTAVKAGTAVITASADDVTASCTVNVTETALNDPDSSADTNTNNSTSSSTGSTTGGTTGTGGTLYTPGTSVSSSVIKTYEMPDHIPTAAFLTVDSDMGANTTTMLAQFGQYGVSATFFVPVGDLYAADDLLRQIAGEGHAIGLLLTPEQAKDPAAAVSLMNTANEQLSVITGTPSRLVRIQGGSAGSMTKDGLAVLEAGGYRLWDWSSAPASYDAAVSALDTTGSVALRLDSSTDAAATLQQLLPYIKYCGIPAKSLSAGDTPICQLS